MQNIAVHRAQDLSPDARQAIERVLGRPLHGDEEVSIMSFAPHDAPQGRDRQIVARKLQRRIQKTARRVQNLSDDKLEETINDAVDYVRSHPR